MKKNEKETAILIAVCAFISLLILSPFMFFLLSNFRQLETFINKMESGHELHIDTPSKRIHRNSLKSHGNCPCAEALFLPFIDRDIPDGKFILLQEKLKGILREHGKNLQKEEKS